MQKAIVFILFIFVCLSGKPQQINNIRSKELSVSVDAIVIDTLTIVPGSEIILSESKTIVPPGFYTIDYIKSTIIFSGQFSGQGNVVTITYRVFPINFSQSFYNRKKEDTHIVGPVLALPKNYAGKKGDGFFMDNQLDKSGSISRGITIGNNQDAVINSNLNLQIAGKLSNDLSVLAAITDENVPIQPDGNSQQIQDFDKVFIQLYNEKTKLIAGDFEISRPQGYFMNANRKAQGGLLNTSFTGKKNKQIKFETTVSGSVSKGRYCRKIFKGQEGNQGPYKLTGCENEQYIVVLAGTERVYIDGKLQVRGKENEYVIDYNTGEIVFTANRFITKDSRIAIEFEYTERSYARFLIYNTNELYTEKGRFWLNVYSEQDSKNQPINQDLSDEQKRLLSESGDTIENTFVANVDSVGFSKDYVLYARKDSVVNGASYEIYEYSTNPLQAVYQVGFSLVGDNKGNYIQIQNSANGKVFKWLAPILGIPQGNYEPIRLLVAPKKQQMLTFGGDLNLTASTNTDFEFALSNYDLNTFSEVDASDNIGYAIKFNVEKSILNADTTRNQLKTNVSYQFVNKNFTAIERFRPVEFERDWNIETPFSNDEHLAEIGIAYKRKTSLKSNYSLGLLSNTSDYSAYRNQLGFSFKKFGYMLGFKSSLLNTKSELNKTYFLRYLASISKNFKFFKLGFENESEQNEWVNAQSDSLLKNSFRFLSYRVFVENPDSGINKYVLAYTLRNDYLPLRNSLKNTTRAENFQLGFSLLKNPSSALKTNFIYRKLSVLDSALSNNKEENTISGRIDYSFKLYKGFVSSSTFYEAGSGLEPKREYSFLKVSTGQGVYTWIDYNNNGVVELNEFEISQFQDEANYIRIYSPGNDYIKTYKNEFSQILNIHPESLWRNKSGLRKVLAKFSNALVFQISQKTTDELLEHSLNPFYLQVDSSVINLSQSIRNTFSFNRLNSKFGVDYIYQHNTNKILLSNGFDERERFQHGLKLRWVFLPDFTLQNYFETGDKIYKSEFFSSKNYTINSVSEEIKLQYQPGFQTRVELNYSYSLKSNQLSVEECIVNNIGGEINYSITRKGNVLVKANYLKIEYNSESNSSIAYEMLQGLKSGNNATWSLMFNKKLAGNLEVNLIYNGRISEKSNAIHTGSLQLRAFF